MKGPENISAGVWLLQNPEGNRLRGVAAVLEYRYTSTLGNADSLSAVAVSCDHERFFVSELHVQIDRH